MDQTNWTKEETRFLISFYEEWACLYDCSDVNFTNRKKRDEAYKFIEDNMKNIRTGVTIKEIKNKIKTLQGQISKEKLKIERSKKSGAGRNHIYTPKLWFYDEVKFLFNLNNRTRRNSNINMSEIENDTDELEKEETQIKQNQRRSNSLLSDQMTLEQDYISHSISQENEKIKTKKSKKRKLEKETFKEFSHVVKVLDEIKRTERYGNDEFDTFGNNIACQLRKLSLERALKIQIKIQELLCQERLDYEMEERKIQSTTNTFNFN